MNKFNDLTITTADFDYSQWQRKEKVTFSIQDSKKESRSTSLSSTKSNVTKSSSESQTIWRESLPRQRAIVSPSVLRKECSSLCRHGPAMHNQPETAKVEKKKSKDGVIPLLKIQIKEKKNTLENYKQFYLKLIQNQLKLKEEINEQDNKTSTDANQLLLMFGKYRDGLSVVKIQHEKEITDQQEDLIAVEKRIKTAVNVMVEETSHLDDQIIKEKENLKILLNYKEKEFPDKIEQICQLKQEIELLQRSFDEEYDHLLGVAIDQKHAYGSAFQEQLEHTKLIHAEYTMNSFDDQTKSMAVRNAGLKKEIAFHKQQFNIDQEETKKIQYEIKILQDEEKLRIDKRKHPDMFSDKCLPHTELELDIPMQRTIPM